MAKVGPDFLCIGMQKAGTGWLYDAFCKVDGFYMLPIKEFRHFGSDKVLHTDGGSLSNKELLTSRLYHQLKVRRFRRSKKKLARLTAAVDAYVASDFSDQKYLELFSSCRGGWFSKSRNAIIGDMSTDYSLIEDKDIRHAKSLLGDLPVMMTVRNPVDRLWSAFNMDLRRRGRAIGERTPESFDREIDTKATLENLEKYCAIHEVVRSSMPSRSYRDWSKHFDGIHVISFEDIRRDPRSVIEQAASVAARKPIKLPTDFEMKNSKERLAKAKMTAEHRAYLYDFFADELRDCKETFPKIAANWPTG